MALPSQHRAAADAPVRVCRGDAAPIGPSSSSSGAVRRARDPERGERVAQRIGAHAVPLDVTDEASVRAAVQRIGDRSGGLDVLVDNTGIAGEQRPPNEAGVADLRRVLETNVVGAAAVLGACTPLLDAAAAPVVVNVSSAVGSLTLNADPSTRWSLLAYPMSEAALNMLTIQYAGAFPRWRVNAVTPGLTATDFAPAARGGHPVQVGAEIIVRMACLDPDGPTGTFVGLDGPVPWYGCAPTTAARSGADAPPRHGVEGR